MPRAHCPECEGRIGGEDQVRIIDIFVAAGKETALIACDHCGAIIGAVSASE